MMRLRDSSDLRIAHIFQASVAPNQVICWTAIAALAFTPVKLSRELIIMGWLLRLATRRHRATPTPCCRDLLVSRTSTGFVPRQDGVGLIVEDEVGARALRHCARGRRGVHPPTPNTG